MNFRIAMSEQKRILLTFIGIVAYCAAGILKALSHFIAPQNILGNLTLHIMMVAAGLIGMIAMGANMPISAGLGVARAVQRREFGTALAFGAIYLAFATVLFGSVYSSSEKLKFAGNVALWFSLAFLLWDTWRASHSLPGPT